MNRTKLRHASRKASPITLSPGVELTSGRGSWTVTTRVLVATRVRRYRRRPSTRSISSRTRASSRSTLSTSSSFPVRVARRATRRSSRRRLLATRAERSTYCSPTSSAVLVTVSTFPMGRRPASASSKRGAGTLSSIVALRTSCSPAESVVFPTQPPNDEAMRCTAAMAGSRESTRTEATPLRITIDAADVSPCRIAASVGGSGRSRAKGGGRGEAAIALPRAAASAWDSSTGASSGGAADAPGPATNGASDVATAGRPSPPQEVASSASARRTGRG